MIRRIMTLTDMDRCRLGMLVTCNDSAAYGRTRARYELESRLEEAHVVPASCTPRTLVTMNSTVKLLDVDSQELRICILAYPEDKDLIPHSVGVLQALGQRLLGRSVGDIIQLDEGTDLKRYRIESIPFQPEAAGAKHL